MKIIITTITTEVILLKFHINLLAITFAFFLSNFGYSQITSQSSVNTTSDGKVSKEKFNHGLKALDAGSGIIDFDYTERPTYTKREGLTYNEQSYQKHPEFGVLPFDKPFQKNVVEDLSKRNEFERYYIDLDNPRLFYIQKGAQPLNYQENGHWRAISPYLEKESATIYSAKNQSYPTKIDLTKKQTSVQIGENEIAFNNYTLEATDFNDEVHVFKPDWSNIRVGNKATYITDVFPGIDMRIIFKNGGIKSDFILNSKTNFKSLKFIDSYEMDSELYFDEVDQKGDYIIIRNRIDKRIYAEIRQVAVSDNSESGKLFYFHYSNNKNDLIYTLGSDFLHNSNLVYPIVIDPLFTAVGPISGGVMGSLPSPDVCTNSITLTFPGGSMPWAASASWNTTSDVCNDNGLACWMSELQIRLRSSCGGSSPTDPNEVWTCPSCDSPGNWGPTLPFEGNGAQELVQCFTPSCSDQSMTFYIDINRTFCPVNGVYDNCDYTNSTCQRLESWSITVQGGTVEIPPATDAGITSNQTICQGQEVDLHVAPLYGVPPYTYSWNNGGGSANPTTVSPATTTTYNVTVTDQCGANANASTTVNIISALNEPTSITNLRPGGYCPTEDLDLTSVGGDLIPDQQPHDANIWYMIPNDDPIDCDIEGFYENWETFEYNYPSCHYEHSNTAFNTSTTGILEVETINTAVGADPFVWMYPLPSYTTINADDYEYINVRYRVTDLATSETFFRMSMLFTKRTGLCSPSHYSNSDPLAPDYPFSLPDGISSGGVSAPNIPIALGEWRVVSFKMTDHFNWNGTITGLRLDYFDKIGNNPVHDVPLGSKMEVDFIVASKHPMVGEGQNLVIPPGGQYYPTGTSTYITKKVAECGFTDCVSEIVTIKTESTPPASITGNDEICVGGSTTLTVNGGTLGTGATYEWYSGSCGGTHVGSGTSVVVNPTTLTDYFVRIEGDCNTTTCVSFNVMVYPDPSIITQPGTLGEICPGGSSNTISVSATGGMSLNYQWQYFDGTNWVNVTDGTPIGAIYTNSTSATGFGVSGITVDGTYQYQAVVSSTGTDCDNAVSSSTTLIVHPFPNISVVGNNPTTCLGVNGGIVISGLNGNTTYSVTVNGSTTSNTSNGSGTITLTGYSEGTYNVFVTLNGCVSNTEVVTLTDPNAPDTPIISVIDPTCTSDGIATITNVGAGITYDFTPS
ncbi:MAG: hypothetical protein WC994_05415, partial [Brumimicrobium sp.]